LDWRKSAGAGKILRLPKMPTRILLGWSRGLSNSIWLIGPSLSLRGAKLQPAARRVVMAARQGVAVLDGERRNPSRKPMCLLGSELDAVSAGITIASFAYFPGKMRK
jgi:hypothetical protein